jgi:hypothetical protein
MPTEIVYTALPNTTSQERRVSVFISPRLAPSGTLADFGAFRWPSAVKGATFELELDNGRRIPASWDPTVLREKLWDKLFPPTTTVTAWALEDMTNRPVMSFPAAGTKGAHALITAMYTALANVTVHAPRRDHAASSEGGLVPSMCAQQAATMKSCTEEPRCRRVA